MMDDEMDEPEVELLSEHPEWADVVPIPQRESAEPVVQILYDNEYSDAMGLLRALMLKGELSPRALHLTTIIIFRITLLTISLFTVAFLLHDFHE